MGQQKTRSSKDVGAVGGDQPFSLLPRALHIPCEEKERSTISRSVSGEGLFVNYMTETLSFLLGGWKANLSGTLMNTADPFAHLRGTLTASVNVRNVFSKQRKFVVTSKISILTAETTQEF